MQMHSAYGRGFAKHGQALDAVDPAAAGAHRGLTGESIGI